MHDMNREILLMEEQLKDAYEGQPWFGRSAKELLSEVSEEDAFIKLNGQHSILELIWHMITWREFTLECLREKDNAGTKKFEELDWRELGPFQQTPLAGRIAKVERNAGRIDLNIATAARFNFTATSER